MNPPKVDWAGLFLVAFGLYITVTGNTISLPIIGGSKPPFPTDKLAVLVVEETSERTPALNNIFGAMEKAVKAAGGDFQKLDQHNTDQSQNADWVKAAWAVKGDKVPWVVGATKRAGVNQEIPATSEADAVKTLAPLGVK